MIEPSWVSLAKSRWVNWPTTRSSTTEIVAGSPISSATSTAPSKREPNSRVSTRTPIGEEVVVTLDPVSTIAKVQQPEAQSPHTEGDSVFSTELFRQNCQ